MNHAKQVVTIGLVLSCLCLASVAGAQTLELTRTIDGLDSNGYFVPGTTSLTVNVAIDVTAGDASGLTAFGVEERWPAGFSFASASGDCNPAIKPTVGTTGTLGFAYIQVPTFPCQFTYVMNVDASPGLSGAIEGEAQYRTDGPQISGPTASDPLEFEPVVVEMTRDIAELDANGFFLPGTTTLTVSVSFAVTSGNPAALTSFDVEERWPSGAGITFASASGACAPTTTPTAGDDGALTFGFAAVPSFPCDFTYTMDVSSPTLPAVVEGEPAYAVGIDPVQMGATVSDTIQIEPTTTSFTRTLSGAGVDGNFFIPGEQITVDIVMDKSGPKTVTALGFEDTVPTGWTYVSASGANVPDVKPTVGATDTLGFAYIAVPAFPASFSYVLQVPANAENQGCLEGEVQFRTDGGQELSDPDQVCLDLQPCVTFTRVAPASYVAGQNMTVEITIDAACAGTITALGFDEMIPAGWTYVSTGGANPPDVKPSANASSPLGWAYIAVPSFPATFTYTVAVPANQTGIVQLSGSVPYRLSGGPLASETVVTEILDVDTTPPTAVCQDITVQLDSNGTATIVAADVDGGSTDNVGIDTMSVSATDFTCADLGANTVTLTVADAEGNEDSCDATVTVEDAEAPALTVQDATVVLNAAGTGSIDAGNVVADSGDNCGGPSITLSQDTFTCSDLGQVIVTVTAEDGSGNQTSDTATVTVVDGAAPVITLIGAGTVNVECGGTYTEAGATALDTCDGAVSVTVAGDTVDATSPGQYTITYNAMDAAGNQAIQVTRTVNVVDTTAPVITLNGNATINLTCGDTFVDPGATATDGCEGDLSSSIQTGGTVNENVADSYLLTYDVSDGTGNAALQVTRTVVVEDTTNPVITLVGMSSMTVECGGVFTDPGTTADDSCDGDISSSVVLGGDTVDAAATGTYVITYDVTDAAGNAAAQVTRTVTVSDTTIPVISLQGANPFTVDCGTAYDDPGATVTDGCDTNVAVVVDDSAVNTSQAGTYTVTFNAMDASGNSAVEVTRTVIVPADTAGPVITLNGDALVAIECGGTYTEEGASALDACDGSTPAVAISGDVDTTAPATYTVTYTASDTSGNESSVTRAVVVTDTTAPVITLVGDSTVSVTCGDSYQDAGATATDTCEGDLTSSIVPSGGNVDVTSPGVYTISYDVSDSAGNAAQTVTRVVTVEADTAGPVITLNGDNPMTVECGSTFTDPGATALDACDGSTPAVTASGTVDTTAAGDYTITYTASDNSGNESSATRTVTVADTTDPAITLIGDNPLTVDCGTTYTDPGATATDNCDSNVEITIDSSAVDTSAESLNGYTVTITATDDAGNAATATRLVIVSGDSCFNECDDDIVSPVITLLGQNPVTIDCGDSYQDAGATATDNCDASPTITVDTSAVNTSTQNTAGYPVTITATDESGNSSSVTRLVIVDGANCATTCQVDSFTLTKPAGDRVAFPNAVAGDTVSLSLGSSVVIAANPSLCNLEVQYDVDGTVVSSSDDVNGYPAATNVVVGSTVLVTASLVDADTNTLVAQIARTIMVVGVVDTNDDGIPDDPFVDLPNDGDVFDSTVPGANCDVVTRLVTIVGEADPGAETVVITLVNPDDASQSVTVTVPRALVFEGETAIVVVRIACDPESMIVDGDATELTSDLPVDLEISGAIFAEVSILISTDMGGNFSEIPDARLDEILPVGICMTGLAPSPGLAHNFYSHPTTISQADLSLQAATGAWSGDGIINASVEGGELCGETTHLSTFGPFEQLKQGPTLKVNPNPAFDRVVGIVQVGSNVSVSFTVKNVGSGNISGTATLTGGSGTFALVGDTAYDLDTNESDTITVRFTPAAAADYSATLTFSAGSGNQTVTLLGSGTDSKAISCLGCGPAQGSTGGGDLGVVLLVAGLLLALTQVRRVRQH